MIKSKHFRKDVIIARVIFLAFCALIIALIVWLVSLFTDSKEPTEPIESNSSEYSEDIGSKTESEIESEIETESETESETEPETEPETQLPTETPTKLYIQVTSRSNLNLRKEPNTNCDVFTSLPTGTKAEILEELSGWYKVSYNGYIGYVSAQYVKVVEE